MKRSGGGVGDTVAIRDAKQRGKEHRFTGTAGNSDIFGQVRQRKEARI